MITITIKIIENKDGVLTDVHSPASHDATAQEVAYGTIFMGVLRKLNKTLPGTTILDTKRDAKNN